MIDRIIYLLLALSGGIFLIFGIVPKVIGLGVRDATVDQALTMFPPETRSQLQITETGFQNGWFTSDATLNISFNPLGAAMGTNDPGLTIQLDFAIEHGPLLITPDGPRLGLAYVTITPSINNPEITQLTAQLPMPEYRLDMFTGLDQSVEMALSVEPMNFVDSESQIVFGGMNGSLIANADQSAEFVLSMGQLHAQQLASNAGLSIAGIKMESTTDALNDLLAPSVAMLAIPAVSSGGPFPFDVTNIRVDYSVTPSPAGPQQLDLFQSLTIDDIDSDFPLGSLNWTSEVNELSARLIRGYYEFIPAIQNQVASYPNPPANSRATKLSEEMALEAVQSTLAISNVVQANVYDGDHNLDLLIDWEGLPQLSNIAMLDVNDALAALTIELNVSLDQAAIMRSPAQEFVSPYVQQGFLEIDNGRIVLIATLRDGELVVNGDIVPLDQFF